MVERRKTEAIVAKRYRNRRKISLFSEKEENYDSDIANDTDLDQAEDKYPVPRLNGGKAISNERVKLNDVLCSHSKVNTSL